MTLKEKMLEIGKELAPVCSRNGKNLLWEMTRAIHRFRNEHPDLDRQWHYDALKHR